MSNIDPNSSSDENTPPQAAQPQAAALAGAPDVASSASNVRPHLATSGRGHPFLYGVMGLLTLVSLGSLGLAWSTHARLQVLEPELVRRQQGAQDQVAEARMLSKQAYDNATETAAKLALTDAKVAESAVQRSQVDDLVASLARSRDENVVSDIEAALRVAQQQSAITGSVEPVMNALKHADDRLARYNQPRLDRVRQAIARDVDRIQGVAVADVPSLSARLDDTVRQADDLPLVNTPRVSASSGAATPPAAASSKPKASGKSAASKAITASQPASQASEAGWTDQFSETWNQMVAIVWREARALVRVTEIDHPEAALINPEQAFFLRENLKLRLLNARLSLLSRQFDQARSDLDMAQTLLTRYFDPQSRRVASVLEQIRLVSAQCKRVDLPRPDETLAALAGVGATQ